jgi:GR25 family glycosyltransferase involved in LPS biosynthesis
MYEKIVASSGIDDFRTTLANDRQFVDFSPLNIKRAYIINMAGDDERMQLANSFISTQNITSQRFNAVNLRNTTNSPPPVHILTKFNFTGGMQGKRVGVVGCWQSHLQVYFEIMESVKRNEPDDPVMVLEDDAVFDRMKEKNQYFQNVLKHLPPSWGMIFLAYGLSSSVPPACVKNESCGRSWFNQATGRVLSTVSYIVRNATVAQILIDASNTVFPQTADVFWHKLFEQRKKNNQPAAIDAYLIKPHPLVIPLQNLGDRFRKHNSGFASRVSTDE